MCAPLAPARVDRKYEFYRAGRNGEARRGWSQSGISGMQLPVGPDPGPDEGRWQPCPASLLLSANRALRARMNAVPRIAEWVSRKPTPYAATASLSSGSPGPVCGNGHLPPEAAHSTCALRSNLASLRGAEGKIHEAT